MLDAFAPAFGAFDLLRIVLFNGPDDLEFLVAVVTGKFIDRHDSSLLRPLKR
jgi:hypothetical protein